MFPETSPAPETTASSQEQETVNADISNGRLHALHMVRQLKPKAFHNHTPLEECKMSFSMAHLRAKRLSTSSSRSSGIKSWWLTICFAGTGVLRTVSNGFHLLVSYAVLRMLMTPVQFKLQLKNQMYSSSYFLGATEGSR